MTYDYAIYGAGPTGLSTALLLVLNNIKNNTHFKIIIIEKENSIGGCWRNQWQNDLFTEHAPRVLSSSSNLFKLFKLIGYEYKNKIVSTYGSRIKTNLKLARFIFSNIKIIDFIKIFYFTILFLLNKKYTYYSVADMFNKMNLHQSSIKAITIYCIALANSPSKLLFSELLSSFSSTGTQFYQFIDDSWLQHIQMFLNKHNVQIIKNTYIKYTSISNNSIHHTICYNFNSNKNISIYSKNHIITLPPHNLISFIKSNNLSQYYFKNKSINYIDLWLQNSSYYSIGIQAHFSQSKNINKKLDISNIKWADFSYNNIAPEYNLILLPTSDYRTIYTKNKNIKTVWSMTIVDTDAFVKKHNKTINELTLQQIINDVREIIYSKTQTYPDFITVYNGVKKIFINNKPKWISKDSAFSLGKYGTFPSKSSIKNLYTIGPHNMKGITVIQKAVQTSINFIHSQNLHTFNL